MKLLNKSDDPRIYIEHNGVEYRFLGRTDGLQVYIDGQLLLFAISTNTVILADGKRTGES